MSRLLDRIRRGERSWLAELILRPLGLLLLASSCALARLAERSGTTPPAHPASPAAFAICLALFALLVAGLGLLLEGPGLFRHVPLPTRSALSWKER